LRYADDNEMETTRQGKTGEVVRIPKKNTRLPKKQRRQAVDGENPNARLTFQQRISRRAQGPMGRPQSVANLNQGASALMRPIYDTGHFY
jgi:hypothetical protein